MPKRYTIPHTPFQYARRSKIMPDNLAEPVKVKCPYTGQTLEVELRRFDAPVPPYTHWYQHPVYHQPVPVILSGDLPHDMLDEELTGYLATACRNGKAMFVVCWYDTDTGDRKLWRKTVNFPHEDFPAVVRQLADDLSRDGAIPGADRQMPQVVPQPLSGLQNRLIRKHEPADDNDQPEQ
jgi:hypothetical protein